MKLSINIDNEDSDFIYIDNVLNNESYNKINNYLKTKSFKDGFCVSGKAIPRQQLWFHKSGNYFCDEWKCRYDRWESNKYCEILKELENIINLKVNSLLKTTNYELPNFNSILINKYRNGYDSIKPHRDSPHSFGMYPIIAILSIGETRTMNVKRIIYNENNISSLREYKNDDYNFEIPLKNNSLFIMAGASQKYFTHEIPKCDTVLERFSLTFRQHLVN